MYWEWCEHGWLHKLGFVDFAGCGAVHMVGGLSGAIGAYVLKPRLGVHGMKVEFSQIENFTEFKLRNVKREDQPAFEKWFKKEMNKFDDRPSNLSFVVVATMLLWVCWLYFNAGTAATIFEDRRFGSTKIMMNTVISGAAGGIVAQFLKPRLVIDKTKTKVMIYDVMALCNGILTGLVSITAVCHTIDPEFAFMIGVLGGVIYVLGAKLFIYCKIDDPLEAGVVHGIGGMWGIIAAGLFNNRSGLLVTNFEEY